jgi:hypothetical protein
MPTCDCNASEGRTARVAESPGSRMIYPRIDPAVIALTVCGSYALLGRQSRWIPGRYSCLAGGRHFLHRCNISHTIPTQERALSTLPSLLSLFRASDAFADRHAWHGMCDVTSSYRIAGLRAPLAMHAPQPSLLRVPTAGLV